MKYLFLLLLYFVHFYNLLHFVYFYDLYFEYSYHLQCFITNVERNTLMDKA